jgi:hypothetical protein
MYSFFNDCIIDSSQALILEPRFSFSPIGLKVPMYLNLVLKNGRSKAFGTQPAAFIYRQGYNLAVFAAMVANIPTVTDFDCDPAKV